MKNIYITIIFILAIFLQSYGQVDQVSVGPSYSQQAYYNLETGETVAIDNEAWDLAFSNSATGAGIFINESATFMASPVKLYKALTDDWTEAIDDTSPYVDSVQLLNPEENWEEGALNTLRDADSPLDYGWGSYNTSTHMIDGSTVYVLQKRDQSFIKFQITSLSGGVYTMKYADLDGSNEVETTIAKTDNAEQHMIYFSFTSETEVEIPNDFDLVIQRYSTPLGLGDGTFVDYTVTGVLAAPGVSVAKAEEVDPSEVEEADYSELYSDFPKTIGHDWKQFDFSLGWVTLEDRAYFVKRKNGEKYKVVFLDFEGSSTGVTTLEKTKLETVSVKTPLTPTINITIFPNPTSDYVQISGIERDDYISFYSISGQKVKEIRYTGDNIDISDLPSGTYAIRNNDYFARNFLVVK